MAAHAKLSPSGAHRWMNCPGSVQAEKGLPNQSSVFAAEGTLAHKVMLDYALTLGLDPYSFVGQKRVIDGHEIEVTTEMVDFLIDLIDDVEAIPGHHYYENRVTLDRWMPRQFGTLDIGIIQPKRKRILIQDLKYGQGVPVYPENNEQLMIYAMGFAEKARAKGWVDSFKGFEVELTIYMPRIAGAGGSWALTYEDLMEFGETVRRRFKEAMSDDAPRHPGPKTCMWCKAQGSCAALAEFNLDLMKQDFDDLDADEPGLPSDGVLSPEARSNILRHRKLITSWLEALHGKALEDALAGRPVPGFVAQLGRAPHRVWTDPDKATAFLQKEKIEPHKPPELRSPADAEKALLAPISGRSKAAVEKRNAVKAKVKELVTQGEGKPTLVPAENAKNPIAPITEDFDDLDAPEP